jgi:hypothetical protein
MAEQRLYTTAAFTGILLIFVALVFGGWCLVGRFQTWVLAY